MRMTIASVMIVVAPMALAQTSGPDMDIAQRQQPLQLEELQQERRLAAEEAARTLFSPDLSQSQPLNVAVDPLSGQHQELDWSHKGFPADSSEVEFEYRRSDIRELNPLNTW